MTYQQRTTHFLGLSIGFLQKVFKLHPKKQKSNPTLSEESSKTLPKTLSQDLVSRSITAYKEAAKSDHFLFGDYDPYEAYRES